MRISSIFGFLQTAKTDGRVAAGFVLLFAAAPFAGAASSADQAMWQSVNERSLDPAAKRLIVPAVYRTVRLDTTALAQLLASAPMEFTNAAKQNPGIVYLPMPDGTMARFRFEESPIMEPGLAAKFPEFKTYRGQGIDDPTASCRFDWMPTGFHAIILAPSGTVLIDPYAQGNTIDYITYWKRDAANTTQGFQCRFDNAAASTQSQGDTFAPAVTSGTQLRTYRLALASTNEYTVAVGGNTIAGALAAEVTIMNRVNGVYERDLAIHMNIIANNNLITYAGDNLSCGGACNASNDPYTNNDGEAMLDENQATIDNVIGPANYDIGHVFSTGGGGIAALSVPCGGIKAEGVTGLSNPTGDAFAIDFVAHEMGHQWGALHTFNGTVSNCGGGNRDPSAAYEPGSGITIMAYAGICGNQNLAAHSIDTFHVKSLEEIVAYSQSGNGNTCAVTTATGNTPPAVTGPGNFTIPKQTPFFLTASATDVNGDAITYDWEEYDLGPGTNSVPNTDSDGNPRPILRPYSPTVGGTRTFPSLQFILNNGNVPPPTTGGFLTGELLPAISRSMTFQVVARDNRANGGGINTATSVLTINGASGPFAVTWPNAVFGVQRLTNLTVTWNVAGTAAAPISAANVKISLSTDGGNTFPTILAASTPNDGSETVLIPDMPTETARVKIEAIGNIFFDMSDTNFSITINAPTPTPVPSPTPTPTPLPTATPTPTPLPPGSYGGINVGDIDDGGSGTPPIYGTPRIISFVVSGRTAPLTAVSVNLNLTHTWVGDVDMVLRSPGGTSSLVTASRIGVTSAGSFGDNSNYNGTYNFTDSAAGTNIWTLATNAACGDTCDLTQGDYRATAAGAAGQTNPPPETSLNSTFGGLTTAQINGTWTLTLRDAAADDTGTVTSAVLTLSGGTAPTPTPTATPTPTPIPTATPSATPTATPIPPTPTATPVPTATPSPTPTPVAQALNISTRMRVETGDRVMIAGFIISGSASKPVILRGMGPSLANVGIPANTVLNDPVLELRGSDGSLIMANDNWKDSPQRGQIEGSIFQPSDDREAVIVATLSPGAYTAILTGKNQTTGVGLVEVYDNNQGVNAQLANISTRGFVQTGNNVMIGGFILGGNPNNTRIALRGVGPSLSQFGLNPVLADPTLELRDSNGTLLIANDNWQDDSVSAAQLAAAGLGLSNSNESGIFTSLPAGAFTAILAGKNGGTGLALVELYNLQ